MKIVLLIVLLLVIVYLTKSNFGQIESPSQTVYQCFKNRFKLIKNQTTLAGVDMVYVISMPQRKEYITGQINKLGVSCTYFDAVKPSDLTTSDYNRLSTVNVPGSRIYKKYTRLPLLLSFVMCFIDSLKKGYSTIVIFEDDMTINVTPDLLNESLLEFKKSPCQVFYMGYCFLNCGQEFSKYKNLVEISDRDLLCCHAMCIKTSILPGLIEYCFPMVNNSDELFRDYYLLNQIRVCVPKNVYFSQNRKSLDSLNQSLEDPDLFNTCSF